MRLSNAVGQVTLDQQLAFIVEKLQPAIDVERSGVLLRLGQAKRQRVELAEISLGH
jgi:hypothetical protein